MLRFGTMLDRMMASDPDYNGRFYTGVLSTRIYCLPSCKARKPLPENIRFFPNVEEARAAGLRPCKRCRPDAFVNGEDADRATVERLVARMREEPGACRTVRDLVAAAGCGSSKLHELFRLHYHDTPAAMLARMRVQAAARLLLATSQPVADVAFEAGFEALSSFNSNFRRGMRMSPQAYRRLPLQPEFAISLPATYPVAAMLRYMGRDADSLTERVEGRSYTAGMRLDDGGAIIRLEVEPPFVRCRILCGTPEMPEVHARVLRLLGLTQDPEPFEKAAMVAAPRLIEGRRGLRIPLLGDVFEALLWIVVGQQVNFKFASTLRRRLVEKAGTPLMSGVYAPPSAESIARLDSDDLRSLSLSRQKAAALLEVSRQMAGGELSAAWLLEAPATRVEPRLLAVRGLGPWSARYLMMRSLGFADCALVGDAALAASLQQFFHRPQRVGPDDAVRLMERFAPYRSLATFHLLRWNAQRKDDKHDLLQN